MSGVDGRRETLSTPHGTAVFVAGHSGPGLASNDSVRNEVVEDGGDPVFEIGRRFRALRAERGWSLQEVAGRSGLSRAFISQIERDQVGPSVASVARLAAAYDISLSELFMGRQPAHGGLVRQADQVRITYGESRFWDEVLSPSTDGKLLVLRSTILPGADSGPAYSHLADEECVVVISGALDLRVGGVSHLVQAGDAMTFDSRRPHAWSNTGDEPVVAIWSITPPIF